jgi:spermidine synthase
MILPPEGQGEGWYHETLFEHYGQHFKIDKILFEHVTPYQTVLIFENAQFGRVMALDGVIQTTTRDEYAYHEMMAHVPLVSHGQARRILVIGGGDGGIVREVLKHPNIEQVTLVEIDLAVVEMSQQYLPSISNGAFSDPRLRLIIADGMDFVRECSEQFDVIMTDSTDPIGPGEILFTEDFYAHAQGCLASKGIVVAQNGASWLQTAALERTYRRLRALYQDPWFYSASVPTYIGGLMSLAWATDCLEYRQLPLETLRARFDALGFRTQYYNPEIHWAAFRLPQYVLDCLQGG